MNNKHLGPVRTHWLKREGDCRILTIKNCTLTAKAFKEIDLRMKKVLEQPSTKDRHRRLGQSSLWPPSIMLHHTKLLHGPLLPYLLIYVPQARYPTIPFT